METQNRTSSSKTTTQWSALTVKQQAFGKLFYASSTITQCQRDYLFQSLIHAYAHLWRPFCNTWHAPIYSWHNTVPNKRNWWKRSNHQGVSPARWSWSAPRNHVQTPTPRAHRLLELETFVHQRVSVAFLTQPHAISQQIDQPSTIEKCGITSAKARLELN